MHLGIILIFLKKPDSQNEGEVCMGNSKKGKLEIYTFGSFTVMRDGENLTHKYRLSKKPWILMKYLLSHRERFTGKDVLAETVGLEDYESDPGQLIHNLLYRLRQMLGEDMSGDNTSSSILFENGGYKWDAKVNTYLDTLEFESLIKQAGGKMGSEPEEGVRLYDLAIGIYKGEFLSESINDDYTHSARTRYRNMFLKAVHRKIEYLYMVGEYDEIIETCENVFSIEYFDVKLHVEYIKALLEKDDTRRALSHYEESTEKLYKQAGITPSGEMKALYKSIKHGKRDLQYSLSGIQDDLSDKMKNMGALFCDIDTFGHIYNLEKNKAKRFDHKSCLLLLSIVSDNGSGKSIKKETEILQTILCDTLRNSDIFSKWSDSQFIIILAGTLPDRIDGVFDRINEAYLSKRSSPDFSLSKNLSRL